ncbi:tetratricopeptide repeat protein [Terrihabitans rhizophilus]|uniref:Tetratricopeptide repeat protein n=1 Tax=Terrihabitans rhizophilus TaxID=3092662 RepID=A0ABU4RP10_9HYPH|nr:tetratricopeptide repeat protein [Terrihabitans sp. PJ23]MDX6805933.1 tetratricopeptide repeat protein [Terrihabitans sp. PJ23]
MSLPAPARARLCRLLLLAVLAACSTLGAARAADPAARVFIPYEARELAVTVAETVVLAKAGDARAQGLLGYFHEYGRGVPQDFVLAAHWYTCAAEASEPTAQYLLGLLFDKGRGVPPDVIMSYKWLNLAAAGAGRDERDAYSRIRNSVSTKMNGAQIAIAQDLARNWVPKRLPCR